MPERSRRRWWIPLAAGALGLSALYSTTGSAGSSPFFATDDATPTDGPTARASRERLDRTVIATGIVRPMVGAEIAVGSRISGTVASLRVGIGDRVRAGQTLARLESTALEAELAEARAELGLVGPRIELAEANIERRRRLAGLGLVSAEDLELAERDLAVEEARSQATLARLNGAEIRLGYTHITAPIDGVIAEISTREGETVAAGFAAPTFVTILDPDRLEVLAYVDETDIGRIEADQSASFTVDTYPGEAFDATVRAIEPKASLRGSVVSYGVRLDLEPRPDFVLRPEMTAHVKIVIEQAEATLTVPRAALRYTDGRPHVVVRRPDGWAEQTVRTGQRSADRVEIRSGLEEGETLLLTAPSTTD